MYKLAGSLALLLTLANNPAFSKVNDVEFCALLEKSQKEANVDIGKKTDEITINRGIYPLCGLKLVTFHKEIMVPQTQFREGWQARKKSQWSQGMCEEDVWADKIREGWTVKITMFFTDGYRWESDAVCPSKPIG